MIRLLWLLLFAAVPASAQSPRAMSLEQALSVALERNPQLLAAEQRWRAAQFGRSAAGAARGPALSLRDSFDKTDRDFNPFFVVPKTTHIAALEASWRAYSGGRLESAEEESRHQARQARWQMVEVRQGLVENVIRAYLDWLQQKEVNEYYLSAIERDQRLENEIAVRVKAGKALEADRLQARIRLLDDQRKLLEGKNRFELARSLLLTQMDMPASTPLEPVDDLSMLKSMPAVPETTRELGARNAALLAAGAGVEAARSAVDRARAESRPTLDVAVRRSHVFEGLSFTSFDANYNDYIAVVDVPVFDSGLRRERRKQAKASLEATKADYANQQRQKELELTRAELDLTEAEQRIGIAREKRDAAAENLRVAKERYDAGTVLLSETLDATANAELAATEEIAARFDVYRARVTLLHIQGRMREEEGR